MASSSNLRSYFLSLPDFSDPGSLSSPLPSLYADLAAHRSSNRTSFDASVSWWKRVLFTACLQGAQTRSLSNSRPSQKAQVPLDSESSNECAKDKSDWQTSRLVLHVGQTLLDDLTIDEVGRPLGLGSVVTSLQQSSHLYTLSAFLNSTAPLSGPALSSTRSLPSIMASIATMPLHWALSQMTLNLGLGDDEDAGEKDWQRGQGDWVIWENVDTVADAVLSIHRSSPRLSPLESLFSTLSFRRGLLLPALRSLRLSNPTDFSDLDLRILIRHLTRDKGTAIVEGDVMKLEHVQGESIKPISEHEKGIVNVRETHARLEEQVGEIEKRIIERQSRVEAALKAKNKAQALSYLRSRKALEDLLLKRTGALETMHGALIKIEQAAGDVEIMKAYDVSTVSLRTLLQNEVLQPDRVEASMDSMQETLADADEVRVAIEIGQEGTRHAAGVEDIGEDEMEAELKRLEEENRLEEEEKRTEREEERRRREHEAEEVEAKRRKEKERGAMRERAREEKERKEGEHSEVSDQQENFQEHEQGDVSISVAAE